MFFFIEFKSNNNLINRIVSRYGEENAKIIYVAACFVTDHPMECWSTQIDIENEVFKKRQDLILSKKIIYYFLENLKARRLDFYTIEFVFRGLYYVLNKTIIL